MTNIAIDGLSTLVGQTIAELLQTRELGEKAFVSIVHGSQESFNDDDKSIGVCSAQPLFFDQIDFNDFDIIFVADNQPQNKLTISKAIKAGTIVIDCANNSDRNRINAGDISLVAAAINGHKIRDLMPGSVIALPSAASTMLAQILLPLLNAENELLRANVCQFVPAAHLGRVGVEQLASQTARLLNGLPFGKGEQLAFNLVPQSGAIDNFAYAEEENRLMSEVPLLLNVGAVINATAIQVPVFYAQSQVVELIFAREVEMGDIERRLKRCEGIHVRSAKHASSVALQASNHSDVVVSRLRQNPLDKHLLNLWCVSDNLRCGPAGNAVQTADLLIKSYL